MSGASCALTAKPSKSLPLLTDWFESTRVHEKAGVIFTPASCFRGTPKLCVKPDGALAPSPQHIDQTKQPGAHQQQGTRLWNGRGAEGDGHRLTLIVRFEKRGSECIANLVGQASPRNYAITPQIDRVS